jgi:hypothetical protein
MIGLFGGSSDSVSKKIYSPESHISCTFVCPAPIYRATYHRNFIVYKKMENLSRVEGLEILTFSFNQTGKISFKISL